eukprot:5140994-Alexandrium_andersonii.AAC.1
MLGACTLSAPHAWRVRAQCIVLDACAGAQVFHARCVRAESSMLAAMLIAKLVDLSDPFALC